MIPFPRQSASRGQRVMVGYGEFTQSGHGKGADIYWQSRLLSLSL